MLGTGIIATGDTAARWVFGIVETYIGIGMKTVTTMVMLLIYLCKEIW